MSDVILEFTGATMGAQMFRHPVTNRNIRAGGNLAVRYVTVSPAEVDWLVGLGLFRVAHGGVNKVSVSVKEPVKRIEPIVQQNVEESTGATAVSNPTEKLISFEDTELDSSIAWMNADEPAAEEAPAESVEDVEAEKPEVAVVASSTNNDKKIQRGRPRN